MFKRSECSLNDLVSVLGRKGVCRSSVRHGNSPKECHGHLFSNECFCHKLWNFNCFSPISLNHLRNSWELRLFYELWNHVKKSFGSQNYKWNCRFSASPTVGESKKWVKKATTEHGSHCICYASAEVAGSSFSAMSCSNQLVVAWLPKSHRFFFLHVGSFFLNRGCLTLRYLCLNVVDPVRLQG